MDILGSSIARLMLLVALVAADLAAMSLTSDIGAGAVMLATGSLMLSAIPAAIYRTGARRAFWFGFALFGWSYTVALGVVPWQELRQGLLTTRLLDEAYPTFHPMPEPDETDLKVRVWDGNSKEYVTSQLGIAWDHYERTSFHCAGQSLAALGISLLGGCVTRVIRGSSRRDAGAGGGA